MRLSITPQHSGGNIERQRFAAAVKGARIAAFPGHHYEFLRAPEATARRVSDFLLTLN